MFHTARKNGLRLAAAAILATAGALASAAPADASSTTLCTSTSYSCDHTGFVGQSTWGFPLGHHCTNYVAWRLSRNGVSNPGYRLGNADTWAPNAAAHGVRVDQVPAVGAVAHWRAGVGGAGSYGHVAYVEEVGAGYIVVAEDNTAAGPLRVRRITTGGGWPSTFIHFKDRASGGVGDAVFDGTDQLRPGARLLPHHYLLSTDGRFVLNLQPDGNLVVYGMGYRALWSSGTTGRAIAYAATNSDGNVVLVGPDGTVVWRSGTGGRGPSALVMQSDGNAVVYGAAGATWSTRTSGYGVLAYSGSDRLCGKLRPGWFLRSTDKRYTLVLQPDGNLVLQGPGGTALWSSATTGRPVTELVMQGDGNLVLYGPGGAVWNSATAGRGSSMLLLQNDGNLVVYRSTGAATWSTGTTGRL
jgi:surface antigen